MSNAIKAESPLVQVDVSSAAITERGLLGYINLRGDVGKGGTKFSKAIKKVSRLTPPQHANTVVRSDDFALYWLGPDEYLLVTLADKQADTIVALQASLDGVFCSVTDVSSGYCLLEVVGGYAQALLAKGCPMELDPSRFSVGDCAQTVIAQSGVLLSPMGNADGFEIIVRRSYADYLQRWLSQMNNGF